MGFVTSDGERLRGETLSAAAQAATDFPLYDQFLRGSDLASFSFISPSGPEEYFHVTGTTTTSYMTTGFLLDGKTIVLYFVSALTLVHNAAPLGGSAPFFLQAGVSASVLAGQTLVCKYDATLGKLLQIGGTVGATGGGGGGGVATVGAGPGISITGTGANPIVNNTGVIFITAGPGISITGTSTNPIVSNTGILSITAGTNISLGGTTQNPIINSSGGGGGGAAPTLFRRTNIAGMVGIDASAFLTSDAHICEVLSVGDFYRYTPSTTIPATDGILAILNTGGGGGQWVRMGIFNPIFQQATFWAIDPSNSTGVADDENAGWGTSQAAADAVPLRTRGELNRRLVGVDEFTTRIFHLLSSETVLSGSDVLTNLRSRQGQGFPIFVGKKTQIGGDRTVTAYAAAVPSSNTGFLLSATGLGGAGNIGKLVTNAAETKWAFIKSSLGANQVRVQQPDAWDAVSFTGGFSAPFTIGETIRVWDLPVLRNYPFTEQVMFPGITACEIQGASANVGDFGEWQVGSTTPSISHCILNGVTVGGGTGGSGSLIGCLFAKTSSQLVGQTFLTLTCCGVLGVSLTLTASVIAVSQTFDLENAFVNVQTNADLASFATNSFSAFNVPATGSGVMFNITGGSKFLAKAGITQFYGSGNAAKILSAAIGTVATIDKALVTMVAGANPFTLAGVSYPLTSLPVIDLSVLTAINGGV